MRKTKHLYLLFSGLYFTEHSFIGNIYTLDKGYEFSCTNISNSSTCIRTLLICRVALGKIYEAKYGYPKEKVRSIPAGYHSVKFGEPKYAKYFVDNDAQVIWKIIYASDLINKIVIYFRLIQATWLCFVHSMMASFQNFLWRSIYLLWYLLH